VDPFLTTDRMVLRRFTPADADALVALDRDPLVRRYVDDGEEPTRQGALDMIEFCLTRYGCHEIVGFWAAVERSSAGFLGWFHFRPRNGGPADEPELGYRLVSSVWSHGFATEGSRALIDHGFSSGKVRRVVAETMAVHVASRRVMEKAGMRLVRSFRADWPVVIPGDEHGDVEYAITRAEWLEDSVRRPAARRQTEPISSRRGRTTIA